MTNKLLSTIVTYSLASAAIATIISLTVYRDGTITSKVNCRELIVKWNTDIPTNIVEECKKRGITYDNSKTSYR